MSLPKRDSQMRSKYIEIKGYIVESRLLPKLITLFRRFKKKHLPKRIILRNRQFISILKFFSQYRQCHSIDNFL